MATATEDLNPPDLLSSVSIDQSMNSEHSQEPENDQAEIPALIIKDCDLLNKINHLHCPFTWKPEDSLRSYNQNSVEEIMNVDEMFDEASGFKLRKYVIHLILCYNDFGKRLLEKSLKHLDEMEKMLLTSMKNRSQDVYFTQINEALFHILHSCRVVMLHTTNQKEKAHQVLQKITPYNKLNATNQAGIWAVRANLYVEFGYEGIKASIQYIQRSTEIDAGNSYWHFMRGMYLGRLRRMESAVQIPSMDEIASLELAMKLKEDAAFMAFAAEVYVETANRSKKKSQQLLLIANEDERRKLAEKNDLINERAAMLFKKSVSLNKNCAHLLFRCGKGMLKLAPPYQDVRLAYEYLKKGLELAYESSFGNHAMALYYMKQEEDYDMAKKYLTKAAESKNFGADIDLIRVNFLVNQDPEALLDSLLVLFDRYDDKMKHQKILAEIESYYLFINYNLMEAIKYMNKLLYLIGDHDDIISVFKSGILRHKLPVSLLEILLSDITDRSSKNNLNAEEEEECRKFMQKLCFQNITLPQPKNENLRKKVLKEIRDNFKSIDVSKAKRSLPSTSENPPRKDYDPVGKRFDKEYAIKYYAEDNSSKHQKTVVDQFFEKYETAIDSKSNAVEKAESSHRNRENPNANAEAKPKTDSKIHPILQQLFDQVKKLPERVESFGDSSEQEDGETKEMIDRLARRLDLHFSLSAGAEISKKTSRSNNINIGASTSGKRDNFDSPEVYRRRSSRSPKRRSRSRESRRAGKDSSYKRSDSRESYRSSKQSYRKRSPSTENRYSTHHGRSTSEDRSSRSTSRDHRYSHSKRSLSKESRIPPRTRKTSSRRSKSKDDRKSPRRRSISKETKYSTRSNRNRSTSPESRKDLKSSRRRSLSKESKYSTRSNRHRSTSRESRKDRNPRRRSISRETKYSTKSNRNRSMSPESRKDLKSSRRRSLSKESKYSTRSNRHRSTSRESRKDRNPRRRSISKETKFSTKSNRNRSTSPESRKDVKSSRRRSLSKESKHSTRSNRHRSTSQENKNDRKSSSKRSVSRESKYSVRSSRRKFPSQERLAGENERRSRREKSLGEESRKRSQSRESKNSSKEPIHKRRSRSRESYKSSQDRRSVSKEVGKRPKSKESVRSSKELTNKRRSPSTESHKPSRLKERSISPESLRSSKLKNSHTERSPSEKRHDRHSRVDDSDSKTIPKDSDKSIPTKERSRSRESRYSSRHSPRPKQKKRSGRSRKYESDDSLTEFDNSDIDYKRDKSKKSHQKDRYEDDRRDYRTNDRRRSSSEETRSIRSRHTSSKEKPQSSRISISSRDRRDNNRRKYNDRKNKKRSPSEESTSDGSRSSRKVDRVRRNSRHPESSCSEDFNSKDDFEDQKKLKNHEGNNGVDSPRSAEKGDDKNSK